MAVERGFKARSERVALSLREEMDLEPDARIDIRDVATHLGVVVVDASKLVDLERLEELEHIQAYAFSACTLEVDGTTYVIINPLRSLQRQVSDIAHELSHRILEHALAEIRIVDGVPFRTCKAIEEEEATILGGTLLLPRPLLLAEAKTGSSPSSIAKKYGVTEDMARFRFNTTGVTRQAGNRR